MPQTKNQKLKILKLMEIIYTQTSFKSPLTVEQLHEKLEMEGIKCENRTISQDIGALMDAGYHIKSYTVNRKTAYYVDNLTLEETDYLMMWKSVSSSPFLTPTEKGRLRKKFEKAFGYHFENNIEKWPVYIHESKDLNPEVGVSVERLKEAICAGKEATFYSYTWGREAVRSAGEFHTIRPVCLIYYGNDYYVLCEKGESEYYIGDLKTPNNSQLMNDFENYRVAEMCNTNVLDKGSYLKYQINMEKVKRYVNERFKAFEDKKSIVLQFDYSSIGAFRERYGNKLSIHNLDNVTYVAIVDTKLDYDFWLWVFRNEGRIQIISPGSVVEEYKKFLEKAMKIIPPELRFRNATNSNEKDNL